MNERAAGIIDGVLRRYVGDGSLRADEADDVRSVVMLRLAQRFGDGAPGDVRSIDDYVAQMTHNAARDVFRERHPDRARLNKRVRAILREDARFVVNGDSCALRDERVDASPRSFAGVLARILARAGGPLRIERLTELAAEEAGIALAGETMPIEDEELASEGADAESQLIARETLTALWDEIRALPLAQRTALLLHLRDDRGASAIPLLVFTGTATLDEIGASLEIERSRMETLWDQLPLADLDIAKMLDITASRVIGLRRAARERLGRCLRRRGRERA